MKGFKPKCIIPGVILLFVGTLMLALSGIALKNWLIVGFGVRTFDAIVRFSVMLTIAGSVITVISLALQLKDVLLQHQTQQKQTRFITSYASDAASPELTRQMLDQLEKDLPAFEPVVSSCRKQMDKMDQLQATQQRLLQTNDALYLSETENTLNRVEQRICRNVRNIINLCIAANDPHRLNPSEIKEISNDNQSKLSDASELIDASVRLINQYIRNQDNDSSEVQSWIKTILKSLEEDNK